MSITDELRQKASDVEDEAWAIRFTEPAHSRRLKRLADELREIAFNLTTPNKGDES